MAYSRTGLFFYLLSIEATISLYDVAFILVSLHTRHVRCQGRPRRTVVRIDAAVIIRVVLVSILSAFAST